MITEAVPSHLCPYTSLVYALGRSRSSPLPISQWFCLLFFFVCLFDLLLLRITLFSLETANFFFKPSNSTKMKVFYFLVHILTAILLLLHFPSPTYDEQ